MIMLHSIIRYQLLVSKAVLLIIIFFFFSSLFIFGLSSPVKTYSLIQADTVKVSSINLWRRGVVVITKAQLYSTKPSLRFCASSNPAGSVSEICDGENLTLVEGGNKVKYFSLVNHSAKTIHHHHSHGNYKHP